jgi:hypothetical protein
MTRMSQPDTEPILCRADVAAGNPLRDLTVYHRNVGGQGARITCLGLRVPVTSSGKKQKKVAICELPSL